MSTKSTNQAIHFQSVDIVDIVEGGLYGWIADAPLKVLGQSPLDKGYSHVEKTLATKFHDRQTLN